jgi:PEP-CTERM motif
MGGAVRKYIFIAVLIALFAAPALADSVQLTFIGSAGAMAPNGVATMPYLLSINTPSNVVAMTCDTYYSEVTQGQQWTAVVNSWATLGDTLWARVYTGPQLQELYMKSAWLLRQAEFHSDQTQQISFAIWQLFAPDVRADSGNWLALADAFFHGNDDATKAFLTERLRIYTPMGATNPNVALSTLPQQMQLLVPEPPTLILFGSGLLAAVGGLRRRFGARLHT